MLTSTIRSHSSTFSDAIGESGITPAFLGDLAGELLQAIRAASAEDDGRACRRERACRGFSDAAAGAGDEDDLLLVLDHGGYLLEQLSYSRSAGQPIPGSRAQVVSLGPVSRLQVGKAALLLAAFGEFAARSRPAGATINLRLQQPF